MTWLPASRPVQVTLHDAATGEIDDVEPRGARAREREGHHRLLGGGIRTEAFERERERVRHFDPGDVRERLHSGLRHANLVAVALTRLDVGIDVT